MTQNNIAFIAKVIEDKSRNSISTLTTAILAPLLYDQKLACEVGYECAWAAYNLEGSYWSNKYEQHLGVSLTVTDRRELMTLATTITGKKYSQVIGARRLTTYGLGLIREMMATVAPNP